VRRNRLIGLVLTALIVVGISLAGCRVQERGPGGAQTALEVKRTEFMMDTVVTITAYGEAAPAAVEEALAEMARIADLMSAEDPGSEVGRLNAAAGQQPVVLSADTYELLTLAQHYAELTDGAFDVTVRPLVELWGIGKKNEYVPDKARIAKAQALVNWRDLVLDPDTRTAYLKRPGMGVDLGGAAKGYAADRARQILAERGVESALIDAGGNIWALGRHPEGKPWRIGIKNPRPDHGGSVLAIVTSEDDTLVTSGDYERYFIKGGVRYHHIFNPRTGEPARASMAVTIIAKNSAQADILSTAVFVLGPDKGLALVEGLKDVGCVLVTPNEEIIMTPSAKQKVEIVREEGVASDTRR
jgi:thiamine biosynthesis lipoprotein